MLSLWTDTSALALSDFLPAAHHQPVASCVVDLCQALEALRLDSHRQEEIDSELDPSALSKLFSAGLFKLTVPQEHGGMGASLRDFAVTMELTGQLGPAWAMTAVPHLCISVKAVTRYCSFEVREQIFRALSDESTLLAFAITEDQGSDVAAMRTRLHTSASGKFLLSGHKQWITNLKRASHVVVAALCPDLHPAPNASVLILVELAKSGISISHPWRKTCVNGSDTAGIFFDQLEIEPEQILTAPGQGMNAFLEMVQAGRLGTAAAAIGLARCGVEVAGSETRAVLNQTSVQQLEAMLDAATAGIRLCASFGDAQHADFPHIVSILKNTTAQIAQTVLQDIDHAYAIQGRKLPASIAHSRDALGLFCLLKGPGEILAWQTVLTWSALVLKELDHKPDWPPELQRAASCLAFQITQLRQDGSPSQQPPAVMHIATGLGYWWLLFSCHYLFEDGACRLTAASRLRARDWAQQAFLRWEKESVESSFGLQAEQINTLYQQAKSARENLFQRRMECE